MFDEDTVLQHRDLRAVAALPHHHLAFDGLPPGEELRLGQHRGAPPARLTTVAPALPLGLQPGGAAHGPHLVVRGLLLGGLGLPDVHDGVRRVVLPQPGLVVRGALAPTAPAATPAALALAGLGLRLTSLRSLVPLLVLLLDAVLGRPRLLGGLLVGLLVARAVTVAVLTTPTATPAPAATAAPATTAAVLVLVGRLVRRGRLLHDRLVLGARFLPFLGLLAPRLGRP